MLGIFGNYSDNELQKLKSIHSTPLHSFQSNNIYIAAGGIPETCMSSISENNSSGWITCGVGIIYENGNASLMKENNWNSELTKQNFSQFNLNGHFALARWNNDKLELFTDQLGVRNIYLTKMNDCIAFSTRLDWISKLNKNISIDWEEFGSRWFLLNQLSDKSILKNVDRMCQGGKAIFTLKPISVQIINQPWHPDLVSSTGYKDFISTLRDFTLCGLNNDRKLSLALSGGIDSRILLAFLISSKSDNWCLHSFNFLDHPDTKIAIEISKKLNIEHFLWKPSIPQADKSVSLITDYLGATILTAPASKFFNLQFYSTLHTQNKIVIDGGFGEVARRRYMLNLLFKGKEAIYNNEFEKIISFLKYNRPVFFNNVFVTNMQKGILKQIKEIFQNMPPVKSFGIEKWLDLFSIRTRIINTIDEQARSDIELVNFMPFIQPTFLKKVFETPVKERSNNKIFYKIIKDVYPALSRFSLVKGDVSYPFGLNVIPAALWIKLKSKLGLTYKEQLVVQFLETMSEYIQDIANSTEVISCEYYDYVKVKKIIDEFYHKKNYSLASDVDWWLSFETWRRTLQNN